VDIEAWKAATAGPWARRPGPKPKPETAKAETAKTEPATKPRGGPDSGPA
jgi:hypothetical protein